MRIFKATYKDKTGKKCKSEKWYIDFRDPAGIRHKIPGFENKRAAESFGRNIETLVALTIAKERPDSDLETWINGLPDRIVKQFVQWGLITGQRAETMKPIMAHLDDYIEVLKARNHSRDYTVRMKTRIKQLTEKCRFTFFRDISKSKIELYLGTLEKEGNSAATRGHYLDSLKTFLNWAVEDHRILSNPLRDLKKEARNSKRKGVLTPEQFIALVQSTIARNTTLNSAEGRERAIMYLLAGSTGLRRQELLDLRWRDLHLDATPPFVLAPADITKNSQEAHLPLPGSVAAVLKGFREYRVVSDTDYVFSFGGRWINTSAWIKYDLKAAELPAVDRDKNEIVFHSLRNSFISFLANSATPMKVVQKMARHSDPKLTYNTYARAFEDTEKEAVKTLPVFDENHLSFCLATPCDFGRNLVDVGGNSIREIDVKTVFSSSYSIAPRGFEPLSPG